MKKIQCLVLKKLHFLDASTSTTIMTITLSIISITSYEQFALCISYVARIARGKYIHLGDTNEIPGKTLPHVTMWVFSFLFLLWNSNALHTYLSHSSTLNVGVVVVGVGGELCLLTRWFKDVSCMLSRLPRNAFLWLANFSLFMGEPRITSSHDANYTQSRFI